MKLHESIEEFNDLIILTAEYTNIPQLAISKDYNIGYLKLRREIITIIYLFIAEIKQ